MIPDEQAILKRLWQMIGDDSVPIAIVSAYEWTINDQVAQSWQRGRVLCIGDATHRHPPINGLGSNTCISDAFNLAWKLAYVIKGYAAPSLLDSLTPERKPVGDGIVRRANAGMEAHRALWAIMRLTPEARQQTVNTLQSVTPKGEALREKWRAALEATDDEVQALGIQMNQSYLGSSVAVIEPNDVAPDFASPDALKEVKISTYPGYHLPHVWLAPDGQSPRVSTLDLSGQGRFTLFTGVGGVAWLKAAEEVSRSAGWEMVKGYWVGFRCDFMDCYRDWIKYRGVDEDGVVLVRPDHFIAWRCKSLNGVEDATAKLKDILSEILGKHSVASRLAKL